MKKFLKRAVIGLFIAAVLVCAGVPTLLWGVGGGSPGPLTDYEAKLNERAAAVPVSERAWPMYREASITLADLTRDELDLIEENERWEGEPEKLRAIISANADTLESVRAGATQPGLGYVTSEPQPLEFWNAVSQEPPLLRNPGDHPTMLIEVPLPHLSPMRGFVRLLGADAWIAANEGDADRFVANVIAMFQIASHAEEHPALVSQLVGGWCRILTFERIRETIGDHPDLLGRSELLSLQQLVGTLHGGADHRLDLTGERYAALDAIQRMYTDDGAGNGAFAANGVTLITEVSGAPSTRNGEAPSGMRVVSGAVRLYAADRAEVLDAFEGMMGDLEAWLEIPQWERPAEASAWWNRIDERAGTLPPDPGFMMLRLLTPATMKAVESADRPDQQRDATICVLALARWRAERGAWPASLDELAPGSIAEVPLDGFSGEPLRYRLEDGEPLLYSIGMDRDDDGGRPAERADEWVAAGQVTAKIERDPDGFDGDWVFLKPADEESDGDG